MLNSINCTLYTFFCCGCCRSDQPGSTAGLLLLPVHQLLLLGARCKVGLLCSMCAAESTLSYNRTLNMCRLWRCEGPGGLSRGDVHVHRAFEPDNGNQRITQQQKEQSID